MKLDVLLTDGNYQNTNAIIRALKSKGLKVGVILNSLFDLNFYSILPDKRFFIKHNLLKTSGAEDFENYWLELENILIKNSVKVFMPVGNISCRFASLYKEKIQKYCKVPVVDIDTMEIAQNKQNTFKFAESIGIPVPKTFYLNEQIIKEESFFDSISYPCVIKKTNFNEGGVIYCNNKDDLKIKIIELMDNKLEDQTYPVIQEFVSGIGTGYYAAYENGICKAYFMHERIHEFPITGGASTLAKSIFDEKLKEYGDKLLSQLKWNGVAMVEFKRTNNNNLRLIEINPKFWGSLELSYAAGINFPYINYLLALGKEVHESTYKENIYFRWTIPHDWLWLIYVDNKKRNEFKLIKKSNKIISNIHWDDPLVLIHNFLHFIIKLFKTKKYPHGLIKQKN
jgi:predicted ATP-grasp superfamily ATP-dependent carboligase